MTKKIKFIGPSKIVPNSKEESVTKLRPILGQNQINFAGFVTEFNKKTSFLKDNDVVVSVKILRLPDKSFTVRVDLPGASTLKNQLTENGIVGLTVFQDLILLMERFLEKNGGGARVIEPGSLRRRSARILAANLRAAGVKIQ